jgi:hypothetical protein
VTVEYLLSQWPLLLCPLVMGPMMWLMMRMNRPQKMAPEADPSGLGLASPAIGDAGAEERLAMLRAELKDIGAQQAAIAAQIARLSADSPSAEPSDPGSTESITRTS